MGQRKTYRSLLQALAVERHGFVTRREARRLGVPLEAFDDLVARGQLRAVGDALFRLEGMPQTLRHRLAEAVLRVGRDAFLSHDSVLALHGLTENEPSTLRVATPHRRRESRQLRHLEVLHRRLPTEDLTTYQGIRSTTVSRALLDCQGLIATGQLVAAADAAVTQGLLLRRERSAVLEALEFTRA